MSDHEFWMMAIVVCVNTSLEQVIGYIDPRPTFPGYWMMLLSSSDFAFNALTYPASTS